MIHGRCHTADNTLSLEFDATPWFKEADAESILNLAQQGWSGTRIADSLENRPGYERLRQLIGYAASRLGTESIEDPMWETFGCSIARSEALTWLDKNRPDVAARLRHQTG